MADPAPPLFDRDALAAAAQAARAHPDFTAARHLFCRRVSGIWGASPLRRLLITDSGTMGIAISITGMNRVDPENGAQQAVIIRALESGGLAGGSRVRAYIDQLLHHGAATAEPHPADARRIRLRPTRALLDAHADWLGSVLPPVAMLFPLPPLPGDADGMRALAERYVAGIMMRRVQNGFTVLEGFPDIARFMERRHGYVLMLALAAHDGGAADVNRAHLSRTLGISPAHVAALLADAEAAGWLRRVPRASTVTLSPDFADRLDVWVARELAIVALWLQARLGGAGPPRAAPRAASYRASGPA